MADLQNALEKALFDRLSAQVTLATVAQHVDEDAPAPLAIIGEITLEDAGAKDAGLKRAEFDIVSEVRAQGRKPMNALQAQIDAALSEWRPADAAGVTFGPVRALTTTGVMGPDAATYFGSQRFALFLQPA